MNGEPRAEHVAEIKRVEAALKKTTSPHLKRDYGKHLKRLWRELRDYDRMRGGKEHRPH